MKLNIFNSHIIQFKRNYLSNVKHNKIDLTNQEDIKDKVIDPFINNILNKCDLNNHQTIEEYAISPPAFHGGKSVSVDYALVNKATNNSDIY